eukprot:4087074-Pleurochrysis_carterae.AAC.1
MKRQNTIWCVTVEDAKVKKQKKKIAHVPYPIPRTKRIKRTVQYSVQHKGHRKRIAEVEVNMQSQLAKSGRISGRNIAHVSYPTPRTKRIKRTVQYGVQYKGHRKRKAEVEVNMQRQKQKKE